MLVAIQRKIKRARIHPRASVGGVSSCGTAQPVPGSRIFFQHDGPVRGCVTRTHTGSHGNHGQDIWQVLNNLRHCQVRELLLQSGSDWAKSTSGTAGIWNRPVSRGSSCPMAPSWRSNRGTVERIRPHDHADDPIIAIVSNPTNSVSSKPRGQVAVARFERGSHFGQNGPVSQSQAAVRQSPNRRERDLAECSRSNDQAP